MLVVQKILLEGALGVIVASESAIIVALFCKCAIDAFFCKCCLFILFTAHSIKLHWKMHFVQLLPYYLPQQRRNNVPSTRSAASAFAAIKPSMMLQDDEGMMQTVKMQQSQILLDEEYNARIRVCASCFNCSLAAVYQE